MQIYLEHIDDENCPACNARLVRAEIFNRHCNGYYNETVVYDCGSKAEFIPNYMSVKWTPCKEALRIAQDYMKEQSAKRKNKKKS